MMSGFPDPVISQPVDNPNRIIRTTCHPVLYGRPDVLRMIVMLMLMLDVVLMVMVMLMLMSSFLVTIAMM
jgi:hypothetical protein